MNTQLTIDRNTARDLASELGLDCEIEINGNEIVITMATGEVEEASNVADACDIIRQYAR